MENNNNNNNSTCCCHNSNEDENNEDIEYKKIEFERVPNKKSIIYDDNLSRLSENFFANMEERTLTETNKKTVLYVGSIKNTGKAFKHGGHIFHYSWGYATDKANAISQNDLEQINYDNNLDSVIDYKDGFSAELNNIFPLIECVRRHYGYKIVLDGDTSYSDIYLLNI